MGETVFQKMERWLKTAIEFTIYESRWILYGFLVKLIWTLCTLLYHFWMNGEVSSVEIITALHDADTTMIANLIKMIITGSYSSFIDKAPSRYHVEKSSSSGLKTKMSTSLVVVTSIFLLQIFLSIAAYKWDEVMHRLTIHLIFIVAAVALVFIEFIHTKAEYWAAMTEKIELETEALEASHKE